MFVGYLKIAGLSAMLSAGIVTAFEIHAAPERTPVTGQKLQDRLPQDRSMTVRHAASETTGVAMLARNTDDQPRAGFGKGDLERLIVRCANQIWPNIAHECLTSTDGRPVRRATRTITVEERSKGESTSVLVRLPTTEMAHR